MLTNDMAELAAAMDKTFKFKIGDRVVMKAGVDMAELASSVKGYASGDMNVFIITHRCVEQCHGGTQLLYAFGQASSDMHRAFEYQLESYDSALARLTAAKSAKP